MGDKSYFTAEIHRLLLGFLLMLLLLRGYFKNNWGFVLILYVVLISIPTNPLSYLIYVLLALSADSRLKKCLYNKVQGLWNRFGHFVETAAIKFKKIKDECLHESAAKADADEILSKKTSFKNYPSMNSNTRVVFAYPAIPMDFCATYKRLLTFRDLPQTDGICKLTLAENGFYLKDAQASCFTCMSCRIEFTPTSFPKEQNRWHDTSCPFHVDHPRYQQLTQNYGSTYADQSSLLRPSRSNIRQETGMEQDHIFYSVHETYSGGAYNIVEQNCEDGGIQDVPNDVLPTQDENVEGSPYNPYPTLEQSVVDVHNHQNSTQEENINSAFYNVNSNLMETMENAGTILNGIHEETMTGASNYMNQIQETTTPDASQTLTSSSVPLSAPVSMHRERSKRGSQSVVVSLAEAKSLGAASRLSHETHPPGNSES